MEHDRSRDFRIIRIADVTPEQVDVAREALLGMALFGLRIEHIGIAGPIEREARGQWSQRVYVEGTPQR